MVRARPDCPLVPAAGPPPAPPFLTSYRVLFSLPPFPPRLACADVINVSGHRLGTAEVEAALALHVDVVEAAVVGYPHPVKGEGIWAYVILKSGVAWSEGKRKELVATVRKAIGPIATPDVIHVTRDLPKTRSGKIMRRILRKVAGGEKDVKQLGDVSTLADPSVVNLLMEERDATLASDGVKAA